ncbi:hypothetical protein ACOSQ2_014399 [Xanthoceras sorbifolium]
MGRDYQFYGDTNRRKDWGVTSSIGGQKIQRADNLGFEDVNDSRKPTKAVAIEEPQEMGKMMMGDVASVSKEGSDSVGEKEQVQLPRSVTRKTTKNSVEKGKGLATMYEGSTGTIVPNVSNTEKEASDNLKEEVGLHSLKDTGIVSSLIQLKDFTKAQEAMDPISQESVMEEKDTMIGLNQNEASVEDPIVVDNQIKAIDHSPDPIQIKPRLRKWKKITRSPSQIAAFGPSIPIQKMLSATRRSRSGSKSPVTKSSPNKVNFGSPSVVKLSDGGKRQSLVSPELLDRSTSYSTWSDFELLN